MPTQSTALAIQDQQPSMRLLRPIAEPQAIIEAQNAARRMVHQALVKDRDFGVIPGTDSKKPTMLKPGAERVALGFGCYYGTPEIVESQVDHDRVVRWVKRKKKWNNAFKGDNSFTWEETSGESLGLYRYILRVPVIERATGAVVGAGVGSCSSMESKYVDRPRDSENTVLKMAYKRAMVAACLTTFGLSDEFTQDVEDLAQSSGDDDSQQAPQPVALTVEAALEMPVPGKPEAWGGNGGKPLGQISAKLLLGIRKFADGKVTEAEAADAAPPANLVRLRAACDLVIAAKGVTAAKPNAKTETSGEGEHRPNPPASKPSTNGEHGATEKAVSGKPKIDVSIDVEARVLMKSSKLSDPERAEFAKLYAEAKDETTKRNLVKELQELLASPV